MTVAANPFAFELPHTLMLLWLAAGCVALWLAKKLHLPTHKSVSILLPMALGLVIFASYVTTRFNYDFLIDDIDIIQTNPDVVEADGWHTLWTSDYWSGRSTDNNLYRPITILSYWVNARLPLCGTIVDGRAEEIFPRYFRGVNIILLTSLAWLIALWLSHYVQTTAAWTVAFLFAGHAVHGEMVNYVVCRADLLAMLGVVGFLYMQRLAIERGRWQWWSALLAFFSVIVALGSKESGIIVLPAALAQAWIGPRHANTEVTDDLPLVPRSVHFTWLLLLLIPLAAMLLARANVVGVGLDYTGQYMDDLRDNPLRRVSFIERLPAAFAIAWFYFRQIFWPSTAYYHLPEVLPDFSSSETILGITLIAVLSILLFHFLHRHRWVAIGIVIAMGQYLLIGNLLAPVGVYAANRLILPFSLAAAILGAGLIHRFCKNSTRRRAVVILPTVVILGLFSWQIQTVNHVWRTEARLMGHDLILTPNHPVAMYNFGTVRAREAVVVDKYIKLLVRGIDALAQVASKAQAPGSADAAYQATLAKALSDMREELATLSATAQIYEQTLALREVIALLDRTQVNGTAALTPDDISNSEQSLRKDLAAQSLLSMQYWDEAVKTLAHVSASRPQSLSGGIEYARTLELRSLIAEAREEYRRVVNQGKDDTDLRIIEARIRYGKLSIDMSMDKVGTEENLAIAEAMLAARLAGKEKLSPGLEKKLHVLNRNAKRYLGIVAWKDGRIKTAIKRHAELLRQYPDFAEAKSDMAQWIEQQSPPDAKTATER